MFMLAYVGIYQFDMVGKNHPVTSCAVEYITSWFGSQL